MMIFLFFYSVFDGLYVQSMVKCRISCNAGGGGGVKM